MIIRIRPFPKAEPGSYLTEDYVLASVQDILNATNNIERRVQHMEGWFMNLNDDHIPKIRKSGVRQFLEKLLYLLRHAKHEGSDFWFGRTTYSDSYRWRAVAYKMGGGRPPKDSILPSRSETTTWRILGPEYIEVLEDMLSILDDYIGRDRK